MTETDRAIEMDIDAQADLLEEEMRVSLEEEGHETDLSPWLVPAIVLAAFIVGAVLMFWL